MRRTVEYMSAVVIGIIVSLSLYFLLINANREGEPGFGVKGGEGESDPQSAPAEHVEKSF